MEPKWLKDQAELFASIDQQQQLSLPRPDAPVAQMDRAFDYESKGRRFESCRAYQSSFLINYF